MIKPNIKQFERKDWNLKDIYDNWPWSTMQRERMSVRSNNYTNITKSNNTVMLNTGNIIRRDHSACLKRYPRRGWKGKSNTKAARQYKMAKERGRYYLRCVTKQGVYKNTNNIKIRKWRGRKSALSCRRFVEWHNHRRSSGARLCSRRWNLTQTEYCRKTGRKIILIIKSTIN